MMFAKALKPSAEFYWIFISCDNINDSSLAKNAEHSLTELIENDWSCASLDTFTKDCLFNFLNKESAESVDSSEFVNGRSLYSDTCMEGFYQKLKKVKDGELYKKKYQQNLTNMETNSPTRMAKLLRAQISTDTILKQNRPSGLTKNSLFGWCFPKIRGKKQKRIN